MSSRFKVAVIGCGRVAGHHCRSIRNIPELELAAVCDLAAEKAEAYGKEFGVPWFQNYRRMFREVRGIDAVAIVTPSGMHFEHALDIMGRYGKHVVVEKPTFMKPSHVEKAYGLAASKGLRLFPVFQNRYNKAVQRVLRGLRDGELGSVRLASVRVRWCRPQRYYDLSPWRGTFAMDGGVLSNQAVHHIDLLRFLGGEPLRVSALHRTLGAKIEVEDTAIATVELAGGSVASIEATTAARPDDFEASLSLVCEKGLAQIGGIAVNELQVYTPAPADCAAHSEDFSGNVYGLGHQMLYQEVARDLGGRGAYPIDRADCLGTLRLLDSLYRSAETGGWARRHRIQEPWPSRRKTRSPVPHRRGDTMTSSKPLRVGIAGYGVVGKRRRQFIDANPNLKTVAVCDRTLASGGIPVLRINYRADPAKPANYGAFDDGVKFMSHYKDLLEEDLDVLFVCLTNDVAAEVTVAGLDKGLHVFCEKPPGRNLDDIVSVIRCERRYPQLKLKYGFNHRYHDSVREALRIVRSGELGALINLRGVYGKSKIINFDSDWRTKRSIAGGGILLDQGIHMVDLLRLFAGEFKEVNSIVSNDFWHHDVEDNAYALMRTEKGVVAMLHSSATQWRHRFHLEMALQKGAIILSGILSGSKSYGAETITVAYASPNDSGDPIEKTTRYNEDCSWRDEINEFTDTILADRPVTEGSSAEALRTMELVYRIYCADPQWKSQFKLSDQIPEDLR